MHEQGQHCLRDADREIAQMQESLEAVCSHDWNNADSTKQQEPSAWSGAQLFAAAASTGDLCTGVRNAADAKVAGVQHSRKRTKHLDAHEHGQGSNASGAYTKAVR